ncbi:PIG-L deacetylase family protein [Aquipseudomonas campi]
MNGRKQLLLRRHRRNKRLLLSIGLIATLGLVVICGSWWVVPVLFSVGWIAHEAWFSDHLFYSPHDDYIYRFPEGTPKFDVYLGQGSIRVEGDWQPADTLILELTIRSSWLGRWVDPYVIIGCDRQDFERGVQGRRYLNLSGQGAELAFGTLAVHGRLCSLSEHAVLHVFRQPDFSQQSLMVIAPHADDAELAAFGLYRAASDVSVITLTQGEIEADAYKRFGLNGVQAARLKGRLRAWDSQAIPLWGGVPLHRCVQLGYYCLQLPLMAGRPEQGFGSRESGESDIRTVRRYNPLTLPADGDGVPSWCNLVADLAALLEHFQPEVLVTAHPELDPHGDHVAATQALCEAVQASTWKPQTLLLYANHLHDNDRWPMGPAGGGVALPPAIEALPADGLWSLTLSAEAQMDKAMALGMQHDLREPLSAKKRFRRLLQRLLAGRCWPATGEDEFFRKAVRRHELFWVRKLPANGGKQTITEQSSSTGSA